MSSGGETLFSFRFDALPAHSELSHIGFYNPKDSTIRGATTYAHKLYEHKRMPMPYTEGTSKDFIKITEDTSFQVEVKDVSGNSAKMSFNVKVDSEDYENERTPLPSPELTSPDTKFQARFEPEGTLENILFTLDTNTEWKNRFQDRKGRFYLAERSPVYRVQPDTEDFLKPWEGSIQSEFSSDVDVYRITDSGYAACLYATYSNGAYHFKTKSTGSFVLLKDRSAPHFYRPRILQGYPRNRIMIPVRESGMGLDFSSIEANVDGKPALAEFDPDRSGFELYYPFRISEKGTHIVRIRIKDRAGNDSGIFKTSYKI